MKAVLRKCLEQGVAPSARLGRSFVGEFWLVELGAFASRSVGGESSASSYLACYSCAVDGHLAVLVGQAVATTVLLGRREGRIIAI